MNRLIAGLTLGLTLSVLPAQTNSTELYYLVFLRPHADRKPLPKAEAEKIQADHMANINRMAASGALVAAGPFDDSPPKISGLFVFKGSLEDVQRMATQDATVVERRNTVEVFAWRGPKGIGEEYARLHKADPKTPEDMGVHPFWMMYRGPNWEARQRDRAQHLGAHEEYVQGMRRKGTVAASGQVEANNSGLVDVVIFQRLPEADARALMNADPAVQSGVLRAEYHGWWCAAHVLPR